MRGGRVTDIDRKQEGNRTQIGNENILKQGSYVVKLKLSLHNFESFMQSIAKADISIVGIRCPGSWLKLLV